MNVTRVQVPQREQYLAQIDRLLNSHVLHGSESLCKLLRYLAEHALDHPGSPLKEYQIATEVFGRSPNFDPQSDSTIRVQAGRLRLKIAEYYAKHRAEFTGKEQVKLRMIMIPTHAAEGNAAAQKAIAEEILGKLADGAPFDRMAQIYSEDSTRDLGGDWGWIERKTLAASLEKVAFSLPVGKISHIIEFSGNYYILKVDEKHGGDIKSLAQVRGEIEKFLVQQEAQDLQDRWLATLRSKAYIKTF